MIALTSPPRVVLYEGADSVPLGEELRFEITRELLAAGYRVTRVKAKGRVAAPDNLPAIVLGLFGESPVGWEVVREGERMAIHSIEGLSVEQVVALVRESAGELAMPARQAWKPWFPVIDYERCTNCMQCLSFCLFDVYGVSPDAKIQVQKQSNCKTDCPACSRVCPEVAILFPKYKAGPINGAEIDAEDLRREAMKVDISALLGGDIYALLRDRSARAKSRFSKERDDERALKERQRCLSQLQKNLDVPPEVLASLPSAEEIQARAEQARLRAQEVIGR
jgi:NAD-dependent dihydropyrimidine dehydrogenase PreA subunit